MIAAVRAQALRGTSERAAISRTDSLCAATSCCSGPRFAKALAAIPGIEARPGVRGLSAAEAVTSSDSSGPDGGLVFRSTRCSRHLMRARNPRYVRWWAVEGPPKADRDARTAHHLALCRIEALADRRIDQLSGGQRQRVALARALAAEPRALFLDEPLTALDASLRETLREEIAALLGELGVTSVYVTHDQAEAMTIADRVVVMSAGRIEQVGAPRAIYERPANLFVATFFGEINRLASRDGAARLVRPEHLRIAPAGEGVPGRVVATNYLGAATRVAVETEEGLLRVIDHEARRFAPGDEIAIVIDDSRVMHFSE